MSAQEHSFTQQVQANFGIIRKVIQLYVDDPDDRSDLQQEILYQAWRSFPSFNGLSKFSTWLYKVSLNTVLTFRRRDTRVPTIALGPAQDNLSAAMPSGFMTQSAGCQKLNAPLSFCTWMATTMRKLPISPDSQKIMWLLNYTVSKTN
jgi:DNA-directed RNA polymerase specialized sigma24 family protein